MQALYCRPDFYNKLNYENRNLNNGNESVKKNIYDGKIYQEQLSTNNILSDHNNISFMWYTDSVKIFRSSKFNVWGFFLIILELPYEERYKLENILLVALWFGDKKPVPNLFLEPLKETLRDLYKGIDFYVKDLNSYVTVRGLILCGTADLPANLSFLLQLMLCTAFLKVLVKNWESYGSIKNIVMKILIYQI